MIDYLNQIISYIRDLTNSDYVFLLKNRGDNGWEILGSYPNGIESIKNFEKKINFINDKIAYRQKRNRDYVNDFIYEFGKFINDGKDIFYYNSEICEDLEGTYYLSLYGRENFQKNEVFSKRFLFFKDLLKYYLQFGEKETSFEKIFELLYSSDIYFIFVNENGKIIFDNFSELYDDYNIKGEPKIEDIKFKFLLGDKTCLLKDLIANGNEYNEELVELIFDNGTRVIKSLQKKTIRFSFNKTIGSFIYFRKANERLINFELLLCKAKNLKIFFYEYDVENNSFYFFQKEIPDYVYIDKNRPNIIKFLRSIHPDDFSNYKKFIRSALQGEFATIDFRLIKSFDEVYYLKQTAYPFYFEDNFEKIFGIIEDQTKLKLLEQTYSDIKQKYSLIFESSNQLLFCLDQYGKFKQINAYALDILGYDESEVINKHFMDFASEDSKFEAALAFKKILESNEPVEFEISLECKYSGFRTFKFRAIKIEKNNSIIGMIGGGVDISELKRLEEKNKELSYQILELNRMLSIEKDRAREQISALEEINRLRNEFISNISHELRTPLASIIGYAETINSDPNISKDLLQEFTSIILQEGKRLNNVINSFLDLSRIERGEFSLVKYNFDICDALNQLAEIYEEQAKQKSLHFTKSIPDYKVEINGDKERLMQSVSHLLINAIKFTPGGGRISLIAKNYDQEFEIIVSDTGIGIPKEDLDKIFNRFYKYKKSEGAVPGTGLSLVLVKKIIDLHKGVILVKSDLNKGASFIIKLPKKT